MEADVATEPPDVDPAEVPVRLETSLTKNPVAGSSKCTSRLLVRPEIRDQELVLYVHRPEISHLRGNFVIAFLCFNPRKLKKTFYMQTFGGVINGTRNWERAEDDFPDNINVSQTRANFYSNQNV